MKLRQEEYCHNCNKYVTFEFDDVTVRQVIICPNCKHEHYRELDGGTILNIRADMMYGKVRIAKIPEINPCLTTDSVPLAPMNMTYEEKEIIGKTEDGKVIVSGGYKKFITKKRWGRDPKQGR